MNPLPFKLKLAIDAALVALIIAGTWYITSDHYQKKIAEIQLGMAQAVQTQLLKNQAAADQQAAKIKSAEEQHAKDQLVINRQSHQLNSLQINGICRNPVPAPQTTGADQDRASRLLSDRVDAAFAELQTKTGQLLERCDQLNIDAIQINSGYR